MAKVIVRVLNSPIYNGAQVAMPGEPIEDPPPWLLSIARRGERMANGTLRVEILKDEVEVADASSLF